MHPQGICADADYGSSARSHPNLGNPHPHMLHFILTLPFPRTLSSSSPVPPRHHCASVTPVRACCVMAIAIYRDQCSFAQPQARSSPSFRSPTPSLLPFLGRHPLGICPVMRSPWRELGETRTVTVDAHGIWLLRMCFRVPWLLFHMVLTPKSQNASRLVSVSPPPSKNAFLSSHACPIPIVTYKVARRRKSFQFSLAVCLVTGHSTPHTNISLCGGGGAPPDLGKVSWSDAVWEGLSLPTWKNGFPRIVIPFPLSSADL
jgi:hypothetical protein